MKIRVKKLKRDTKIVIVSVIILTIISISVSYSAIFSVKSQSTVQEISTGTLDVVIDNTSTSMRSDEMYPTANEDLPKNEASVVSGEYAQLNLSNSGTLDAEFSVTISYDIDNLPAGKTEADLVSLSSLNVGIFDVDNNVWKNFSDDEDDEIYYTSLTGLVSAGDDSVPILRDVIESQDSRQFRVYVWLSEDTPTSDIGKLVYLKLDVKSTAVNGRVEG